LYTDELASNCNLLDTGTATHAVFVVYTGPDEIASAEFRLATAGGAALTYLGESVPSGGSMGQADTGIAVALGDCFVSPKLLLTVLYQGLGVSAECSTLEILSDPRSTHQNGDKIAYTTCLPELRWADPGHITVNPGDDCECDASAQGNPSPVTASTWGGIKSLYTH
jgi:hypothetical protein